MKKKASTAVAPKIKAKGVFVPPNFVRSFIEDNKPDKKKKTVEVPKFICVICENISQKNIKMANCGHNVCKACWVKKLEQDVITDDMYPVYCPCVECQVEVDYDMDIHYIAPVAVFEKCQSKKDGYLLATLPAEQITCNICYEKNLYNNVTLYYCEHVYCQTCWKQYLEINIKEKNLPLCCPIEECDIIIDPINDIKDIVDDAMYRKFKEFEYQYFLENNMNDLILCKAPNCRFFMWKTDLYTNQTEFKCTDCDKNYCLRCFNKSHFRFDCKEFDADLFKNIVEMNCTRCPACKMIIQRVSGCDHMTCRCGNHFCFKCGVSFDQNSHQCAYK